MSPQRVWTAVLATLIVLALAMQVRGALFWSSLESTSNVRVSGATYVAYGVQGGIILLLGVLAMRGNRIAASISEGLLVALMVWHSRGSFKTAGHLRLGAPGEREIALWALRSAFLYLVLAASFASWLIASLLRTRQGPTNPPFTSKPGTA